jgi:hypothetical protein
MRRGFCFLALLGAVLGLGAGIASAAEPPGNDDFADALPFNVRLGFSQVESEGATTEPGESAPQGVSGGASVWFEWTAAESGGAEFSACWGYHGLRPVVGVYTGEAVGAMTPAPRIYGKGACEYGFEAVAGVTYRIQVEGESDPLTGAATTGGVDLDLRRFPFNDDLEDAADVGKGVSTGVLIEEGNVGATKQPGEPDHDGDPGGHSVWFVWTAPTTGEVLVTACAATFPPLLAAYTGTEVAALTPVGAGAGEPGVPCNADPWIPGQMNFHSVAGTRYEIAVDGRGGTSGFFRLIIEVDEKTQELFHGEHAAGGPPPPRAAGAKAKLSAQITGRHIDQTRRSAVFDLRATAPGTRFRCKLDRRRFTPCGTKVAYRHLVPGRHLFSALAVGPTGAPGAPVATSFAIRRSG